MSNNILKIILPLMMLNASTSFGQNNFTSKGDTSKTFTLVETMPEFPGGTGNIQKVIKENLKYPDSAIKDSVTGKVFVNFVVDTTGNLINIKILKGVREDLDNEALRVVGLLNGWTPGIQRGKKVKVAYSLPIHFTLNGSTN